jgi:hypothetical protein
LEEQAKDIGGRNDYKAIFVIDRMTGQRRRITIADTDEWHRDGIFGMQWMCL